MRLDSIGEGFGDWLKSGVNKIRSSTDEWVDNFSNPTKYEGSPMTPEQERDIDKGLKKFREKFPDLGGVGDEVHKWVSDLKSSGDKAGWRVRPDLENFVFKNLGRVVRNVRRPDDWWGDEGKKDTLKKDAKDRDSDSDDGWGSIEIPKYRPHEPGRHSRRDTGDW